VTTAQTDVIAEFVQVRKTFGKRKALADVSFEVHRGEFFSLLGPSGCGKTTTLRLLAGFEQPDAGERGEVRIDGELANHKRPHERNVGMVFQNYALFPHLSVAENVAFGLERRRVPPPQLSERTRHALEMVRLDPDSFGRRMPEQLSGGERQRVALARALIVRPKILLLDEPLAALDPTLRKEMQSKLKELNKSLGITFVYVTHDQDEALAMSDRIGVMDHGVIAQLGTPLEIYERPRTAFVAGFIGESNFFAGTLRQRSGDTWEASGRNGTSFRVPHRPALDAGQTVRVAVRPEWMELCALHGSSEGENRLEGTVHDVSYSGAAISVVVTLDDGGAATVRLSATRPLALPCRWHRGDRVAVAWRSADCHPLEEA
jgi:spermidine/putrescine transport system ATP-binding protein